MPYETQFGDVPTHRLPVDTDQPLRNQRYIVRVEEGQSIPAWGSTKRLTHGPAMLLREGERVIEFDLPDEGDEHAAIREALTDGFRDDEHYASFRENTPVVALRDNA